MKKIILLSILITIFLYAKELEDKKIDDWEYNQTIPTNSSIMIKPAVQNATPMLMRKKLGLSIGGAKDANNFYENIKNGYLPKIDSITYESVFYDHRFSITQQKCKKIFCPNTQTAIRKNLFSNKVEYFLAIGLDSNLDIKNFKRKKLNLVVVLDISGSMSSPFDSYYYDKKNSKEKNKSKMQIATKSIVAMINHLKDYDSFGVVLFDHQAYLAKPLREIAKTDIEAIKKHILKLTPRGGTNWSAGYKKGLELFKNIQNNPEIENRIIFITDAMPNSGELRKDRLFDLIKNASKKGIYTTVIGVGVDFNNNLVEYITKTKGANYLSVHSSKEFEKRLDDEFDYLVTPLIFDLKLQLLSDSFKVKRVYASATNQKNKSTLISINTLFPSSATDKGVKGGIILALLEKIDKDSKNEIKLKISYHDRYENYYENIKKVNFESGYYYGGSAIQKAIILTDYVNILKNFLVDLRRGCNDKVFKIPLPMLIKKSIYPPVLPPNIKTWERKSCKLKISAGYRKLFSIFLREFQRQKYLLRDPSLKKEEDLLKFLLNYSSQNQKKDDWNFIR